MFTVTDWTEFHWGNSSSQDSIHANIGLIKMVDRVEWLVSSKNHVQIA